MLSIKNVRLPTINYSIFSSTQPLNHTVPQNQNFPPSSTNLSSALQHYINSDNPSPGRKIHTYILKIGFNPNINISIKLLILHLKSNCLRYARQVFDTLPQPTLSAYNYMINGYVKNKLVQESLDLVRGMVLSGEKPDGFTFSMILKASTCDNGGFSSFDNQIARQVHAQIVKSDIEQDDVLCTVLVDSYVKHGKVGYARKVFDLTLEKNVICSTSMISGYMSQGSFENAEYIFEKTVEKDIVVFNAMIEGYSKSIETAKKSLEVYIDMQRMSFRPNISTFASVIGSCSILAAYEVGEQLQGQIMKTNVFTHIKIGSALLDMYSKCGKIDNARTIFDHMPEKNVFSWTSMIDGYGKNGNPNEALELFDAMQKERLVEPNHVTFLGALSACGHTGLVAKGLEIFETMKRNYAVKPGMEHYACMVDLLGRGGGVNQAWEFIKSMPEKPNADVWAAFLGACNLHSDVKMARIAANELFKINPNGRPGAYVALSNTLAAAEKWNSVSELRELMKAREVSKDTGRSWVGTDCTV